MDLARRVGEPLVGTHARGDERDDVARAGAAANEAAAQGSFVDYRQRKAAEMVRAHDADLARWSAYLANAAVSPRDWALDPSSWAGVTWGLVDGFVRWQVEQGYAIGSINRVLSTVKQYAKLAAKAGTLDRSEAQMIRAVTGYGHSEGRKADEKRAVSRNRAEEGRTG